MQNKLIVTQLKKTIKRKTIVSNLTLEVSSGEIIGLLGPNGAGKTTSFYMIAGLITCESGTISLNDVDITYLPIHKRSAMGLGYLPQEASIFRQMTVRENIQAILELKKMSRQQLKQETERLLTILNIEHLENVDAVALSGGERRRCEIARALANHPKFILLDEPFAGVDPIAVNDIGRVIKLLSQMSIGVIITDHNVRETLKICDKGYIFNAGSVLTSGTPETLIQDPLVKEIYLGEEFIL